VKLIELLKKQNCQKLRLEFSQFQNRYKLFDNFLVLLYSNPTLTIRVKFERTLSIKKYKIHLSSQEKRYSFLSIRSKTTTKQTKKLAELKIYLTFYLIGSRQRKNV
jgi:hypothetical protein